MMVSSATAKIPARLAPARPTPATRAAPIWYAMKAGRPVSHVSPRATVQPTALRPGVRVHTHPPAPSRESRAGPARATPASPRRASRPTRPKPNRAVEARPEIAAGRPATGPGAPAVVTATPATIREPKVARSPPTHAAAAAVTHRQAPKPRDAVGTQTVRAARRPATGPGARAAVSTAPATPRDTKAARSRPIRAVAGAAAGRRAPGTKGALGARTGRAAGPPPMVHGARVATRRHAMSLRAVRAP